MAKIASAQKPLFAYLRTLLGATGDVDDLLQEVNLVLWRRGQQFDGRGEFLAWAYRIAYLKVLGHQQKRQRQKHVYIDSGLLAALVEAGHVVEEIERIDARLDALRRCLAKLPVKHRHMLMMRYEVSGSVQKVADLLERPVGSVRVTLHRLRQRLADCIERTLAEEEGHERL